MEKTTKTIYDLDKSVDLESVQNKIDAVLNDENVVKEFEKFGEEDTKEESKSDAAQGRVTAEEWFDNKFKEVGYYSASEEKRLGKKEFLEYASLMQLPTNNGWISVEDQAVPNDSTMLFFSGGTKIILRLIDDKYYGQDGTIWKSPITHFQQLPQSPIK